MSDRAKVALIAWFAALPSVVWGFAGGGFLTDDWAVWLVFEKQGVLGGLQELAFEQPARPLAAPYYALLYLVIGDSPVVQALLMAVVNGAVVISAWWFGREVLPRPVLWSTLVVLAAMPNHATTRYWFVVGTYPLALALVLLALGFLVRRRPWPAASLLVASTLLYEGAVVLGLALAALWTLRDLRVRAREGLIVALPTVAVAGASFLLSPKRGNETGPGPLDNADTFVPGQVGLGLWGTSALAVAGGSFLLLVAVVALVRQLPSFRSTAEEYRWILIGSALCVLGAIPYFVSGSIFATTGVFDRNNLVPGVGVALVLGATGVLVWRRVPRAAVALGVAVAVWFSVLNVEDLQSFTSAVEDGERVIEALATTGLEGTGGEELVVVPAQPSSDGVAAFIYPGDLEAAARFRLGGDWSGIVLIERTDCLGLGTHGPDIRIFDWRRGVVERVDPLKLPDQCDRWVRSPQ